MADKILFEIVATAKGVKVVQKQTDDLARSTDRADKSTKKLSKSRDQYNRREKGAAQISSNSTKNFSKMQQGIDGGGGGGGLVRAYALLAANVFALSAAFGVLSRSAQIDTLVESMQILSTTGGQNIENLSRKMQAASGGAIDLAQSFRQVSLASSAGLNTEEIEGLTMVAKGAALSLGRDLPDAMDRIFRGAIKLEPEILDEIGLFVRVDEASQKYAQSVGKSASSLTQLEKRQAFLNEILEQGTSKFQEYATAIEPDPYVQLSSALFDLAQGALSFINAGLGPVIKFLTNNPNLLAAAFASLVVFLMSKAIPALGVFNMNAAAGAAAAIADEQEYLAQIQATMSTKENSARNDIKNRQKELEDMRKVRAERDAKGDGVYNIGGKDAAKQQGILTKLNRKNASDKTRADALDQRLAALKSSRAKATKKETIAAINAEITARENQQKELRQEITLRKELANIPVTGKPDIGSNADRRMNKLEGKAASSGMIANATGIAETKGLKAGFKDLFASAKKGTIEIDGVERKLGKTSKTMHLLKGTTSLAGVGFQKLTMMMGPAMMILGMLTPFILMATKAMGFGSVEAKAFEESVKTLSTQLEGLTERMSTQTMQMLDNARSFQEIAKAQIAYLKTTIETNKGIADAIAAHEDFETSASNMSLAFQDLTLDKPLMALEPASIAIFLAARMYDNAAEKLAKVTQKATIENLIGAAKAGDTKALDTFRMFNTEVEKFDKNLNLISVSQQNLANTNTQYNKALAENSRLRVVSRAAENSTLTFSEAMVKSFGEEWRTTSTLTDKQRKLMKARFGQLRTIKLNSEQLEKLNFTTQQSSDISAENTIESEKQEQALSVLTSAMQASKDSVNAFKASLVTKGPVDSLVNDMSALKAALKDVDDTTLALFNKKFDDDDYFLNQIVDKETILIIKQGGEAAQTALAEVETKLKTIQRTLIMNKIEQKQVNEQVKRYNKLMGISTANINNVVKAITKQKTLAVQLNSVNRDMSELGQKLNKDNRVANDAYVLSLVRQGTLLTESLKTASEMLGVTINRKDLMQLAEDAQGTQLVLLEETLQKETELEQAAKRRVAVAEKIFQLENKLRIEKEKTLKLDETLFNMSVGGTFAEQTSMQKATAEIESAKFAVDQALLMKDIKMAVIKAEYALLKAQMRVLSETEGSGVTPEEYTTFSNELDRATKIANDTFERQIDNLEKKLGIAFKTAGKTAFADGNLISALLVGGSQTSGMIKKQIDQYKKDNPEAGEMVPTLTKRFVNTGKDGPPLHTGLTDLDESSVQLGAGSEGLAELEAKLQSATDKSDQFRMSLMVLGETLKGLGPQGELVVAFASGGLAIMNSLSQQKQNVEDMTTAYRGDKGLTKAEQDAAIAGGKTALKLSAAGEIISSIGGMMAANSTAQIAELDGQIAAEKRRDGSSKESLAKIASMEKKKETMKRKAFETDKKMKMAQTVMSTAAAMMAAASQPPGLPTTMPAVMMAAAMGAVQLAVISQMKYSGGATSAPSVPSTSMNIGKKENKVDVSRGANSGELNFARGGKGSGSGMGSFSGSGAAGMKSYAAGGSVLVGERGPEIVTPMAPMEVTPNDKIGGGVQNINFSINAVDSAGVEDLLVNQRGNIIRMIREAANDTGERFLETVDTQAYGSSS